MFICLEQQQKQKSKETKKSNNNHANVFISAPYSLDMRERDERQPTTGKKKVKKHVCCTLTK